MASGPGARPKKLQQQTTNGLPFGNTVHKTRTRTPGVEDQVMVNGSLSQSTNKGHVSPAKTPTKQLKPFTLPSSPVSTTGSSVQSPVSSSPSVSSPNSNNVSSEPTSPVNITSSSSAKGKGGLKEEEASRVEAATEEVLVERLKDVTYEPSTCKLLSQELAAQVMERLKLLKLSGYKLVAVVSVGSLKERPGMQFGSRCLWNDETDKFASVKFTNGSLFAVAMVYALRF